MKKFWIYMAMPVALLNACQRQQGVLEDAKSMTVESESIGENMSDEDETDLPDEDMKESISGGSESKEAPQGSGEWESGETKESAGEAWGSDITQGNAGKPAGVILSQNSVKEQAFEGSTVSIVQSENEEASRLTESEIEAMVREAAADLDTVVKNGQTVVLKPNLVQMIVDSTGEKLDREVNGVTTDWRVVKAVVRMVRELNPDGKERQSRLLLILMK